MLFFINMNDLCDNLHNLTCLCADDSTIFCLLDKENAIISVRMDLQKMYEWGAEMKCPIRY